MSVAAALDKALLALGKAQLYAMFGRQADETAIDDSEFVPLLECVLTAFEGHAPHPDVAEELWEYAFGLYDRDCREVEPESSFEENRDLMRRYLLGPRGIRTRKGKRRG